MSNEEVKVKHGDLYLLLVASQRYAMGRSSYITGSTADAIQNYWEYLTPAEQGTLRRDLREALDRAEESGKTLGMDMDHDMWKQLLAWMQ